jgi:pimeloyl-ACP methyl ester carboxylesterase
LLAPIQTRPLLIAHSAGTALALCYAHAHPERIAGLVLVSPYFLQQRPPWHLRTPGIVGPVLRTASTQRLAKFLLGSEPTTNIPALDEAAAQLHRPGVAQRTARRLAQAQRQSERAELRTLIATCPIPIHIITGELDPLTHNIPDLPVTTIAGAGHNLHLTHPTQVAAAARSSVQTS